MIIQMIGNVKNNYEIFIFDEIADGSLSFINERFTQFKIFYDFWIFIQC